MVTGPIGVRGASAVNLVDQKDFKPVLEAVRTQRHNITVLAASENLTKTDNAIVTYLVQVRTQGSIIVDQSILLSLYNHYKLGIVPLFLQYSSL